jgi:DNA-binding MarR family transcriptional regulator
MVIELAPESCDEPLVIMLFSVIVRLGIFGLLLDPERELAIGQLRILIRLYCHDSLTMGLVAEILSVSSPTATGIVNRLFARGLLERVPDSSDRRPVRIQLSPQGLEKVVALRCIGAERAQAVLA